MSDNFEDRGRSPSPTIIPTKSILASLEPNKLIYGYIRRIPSLAFIPRTITHIVIAYYPMYEVFAIGGNGYGEFALGHKNPIKNYIKLPAFSYLCDNPAMIYGRCARIIIQSMSNPNILHSVGANDYNQLLGYSLQSEGKMNFEQLNVFPSNVYQRVQFVNNDICCNSTLIKLVAKSDVNDNKCMIIFGDNNRQQLTAEKRQSLVTPHFMKLPLNLNIIQIACGFNHTLLLTDNGRVYSRGSNVSGQCGVSENTLPVILSLTLLKTLNHICIVKMECGARHSILIDSDQNIWCFGKNLNGELGIEHYNGIKKICFPVKHDFFVDGGLNVNSISCGVGHSAVITDKHQLYLFGGNSYGQIGNGKRSWSANSSDMNAYKPFHFQSMFVVDDKSENVNNCRSNTPEIVDLSLGWYHSIALDSDLRSLYVFGSNHKHECCSLEDDYILQPHRIDADDIGMTADQQIRKIIGGWYSTIIVVSKKL